MWNLIDYVKHVQAQKPFAAVQSQKFSQNQLQLEPAPQKQASTKKKTVFVNNMPAFKHPEFLRVSSGKLEVNNGQFDLDLQALQVSERRDHEKDEPLLGNLTVPQYFRVANKSPVNQYRFKFDVDDPAVHQLNLISQPLDHKDSLPVAQVRAEERKGVQKPRHRP